MPIFMSLLLSRGCAYLSPDRLFFELCLSLLDQLSAPFLLGFFAFWQARQCEHTLFDGDELNSAFEFESILDFNGTFALLVWVVSKCGDEFGFHRQLYCEQKIYVRCVQLSLYRSEVNY